MQTVKIPGDEFDRIADAADHGSYTRAEVTLLSPNLNRVEKAGDAQYLVVESAYTVTIIQLTGLLGRPYAILERE